MPSDYSALVGKFVTIISGSTNQPITPDSIINLFSGKLESFNDEAFFVRLIDGTLGIFFKKNLVGIIENKVVNPQDPEFKSLTSKLSQANVNNNEGSRDQGDGQAAETSRPEDT